MKRSYLRFGLAALIVALIDISVRADVFNMPTGQTSLQFVTVGDPGNVGGGGFRGQFGSVGYVYQMGKYDVTIAQYCQFLNAVAQTDTYGLYYPGLAGGPFTFPTHTDQLPTVGIVQTGSPGSYSYAITGSYTAAANCPIFDVTWTDAARFCNWLQNGQPTTGIEDATTTETGVYTLNAGTGSSVIIPRNAGAKYFIPSANEWFKAAYYNRGATSENYWYYATQSDTLPSSVFDPSGTNNANCTNHLTGGQTDPVNYLTPVGAFSASPGPYGTYDQTGDVYQWTEAVLGFSGYFNAIGGGSWFNPDQGGGVNTLDSRGFGNIYPSDALNALGGFRVASLAVPEPGSLVLLACALVAALIWRRSGQ